MFASFAHAGDLFKGSIMLHHLVKIGLLSRKNRDVLPCAQGGRHMPQVFH